MAKEVVMQLTFTPEEFHALVRIMLAYESEARAEKDRRVVLPLADKIIAHDLHLGSDELEDLEVLLRSHAAHLRSVMQSTTAPGVREQLQHERDLVEHIIDKVTEACAMV
ncbi:MAG TPA: hypothetical protein VF786_08840 [Terriglobales bacterium]